MGLAERSRAKLGQSSEAPFRQMQLSTQATVGGPCWTPKGRSLGSILPSSPTQAASLTHHGNGLLDCTSYMRRMLNPFFCPTHTHFCAVAQSKCHAALLQHGHICEDKGCVIQTWQSWSDLARQTHHQRHYAVLQRLRHRLHLFACC